MHRPDGAPAGRLLALRRRMVDRGAVAPGGRPDRGGLLQAEADARVSAERLIDEGGTYAEPPARRVLSAVGH
jgi:hypothetical protein